MEICSHFSSILSQSYITYLYEYPLDKSVLESHLSFILSQLDYEILEGRDCALEMIDSILITFPRTFVADNCDLLYVSLAARLINEPQPELRKKIAALLRKLMSGVAVNHGEKLLDICLTWMKDAKVAHKRLGKLQPLGMKNCGTIEYYLDLFLTNKSYNNSRAYEER